MISIPLETKNQYKAYEREMQVFGNLYLAKKRISNNLLDQSNYSGIDNCTYSNGVFLQTTADTNNNPEIELQDYSNGYVSTLGSTSIKLGLISFRFQKTANLTELRYKVDGNVIDTGVRYYVSHLENNKYYYIGATFINITQGQIKFKDFYINEDNSYYEEYGVYVNDYSKSLTTNNLFNIKNCGLDVAVGQTVKVIDDKFFLENTYNTQRWVGSIRLINLNDYKSKYLTLSFNLTSGYCEIKRGTINSADNNYIISWATNHKYTYLVPDDLEGNEYLWITSIVNANSMTYLSDIMLVEGQNAIPYERYMSSPFKLTEENECKILEFNINEKTDIYYTSLPYNTMEIEVDNEKGYFTDYDPDSIVNKLNNDCYVDLFIKINDDDYYKIMTMQFDKISSSDYEKAKLSFKSSISLLSNLILRDKDKLFNSDVSIYKNDLITYFKNNYKINLICDNNTNDLMYKMGYTLFMTPESILLHAGTRHNTLEKAVLTLNDSQDNIVQRTWKNNPQDTILLDYQQEKPIVKREDVYRGIQRKYISSGNWVSSTETFNYVVSGKLSSKNESIVLFNNNYKIKDITISDITISGNVSVSVNDTTMNEALELLIKGNINDEYTITLTKPNITKKENDDYVEESIGSIEDTTKILKITETAPLQSGYYNFILSEKQVKSNIEAKIFGLPYLEIGDTVEIETENAKILMTITEIDMNFDGGLLETIKGYELGWDALFPSDTLYPSDDLYPNTPI